MNGPTPAVGAITLVSQVGAPPHPSCVARSQAVTFFWPKDTRGIVVGDLNRVDVQAFQHLRPGGDTFEGEGDLGATGRACWPMRAIAEDHNAFVLLSSIRDWGSKPTNEHLYTTHELVNGTWNISEFQVGRDMDYALVPGGKMVRAYNDGSELVIQVRDQVLNRPSRNDDRWSSHLAIERLGHDTTVANDNHGVVILPEFIPLLGVNITADELVIELDYWRGTGYETPAFELVVVNLSEILSGQPINSLLTHSFTGSQNYLRNMPNTGDQPCRVRFTVPLRDANFTRGFQVAARFRSCAIQSITPRWDLSSLFGGAEQG